MKINKYSEEQLNWIKDTYLNTNYTLKEIAEMFTKKFNPENKVDSRKIHYVIGQRLHVTKNKKYKRTHYHKYTEEEVEWIKDKYLNTLLTCEEIAKQFNDTFGFSGINSSSRYAISDLMTRKNHIYRGTNIGRFGKGKNDKQHAEVGTIMACVRFSHNPDVKYYRIKVGCKKDDTKKSGFNAYYQPLHKYIYEKAHGKLSKGEFVIFADGDTSNFDLNNLIKVNKKINGSLATHKMHNKGIVTKAYVECERLGETIEQIAKGE